MGDVATDKGSKPGIQVKVICKMRSLDFKSTSRAETRKNPARPGALYGLLENQEGEGPPEHEGRSREKQSGGTEKD